jgi:hypothetical protein
VSHGFAEIAACVALEAGNITVFPEQREFRPVVVESCVRFQRLPACGDVTVAASALEGSILKGASMRIHVAVIAARMAHLAEPRHSLASNWLVATGASCVRMFPCQRVGGLVVIKLLRWFPLSLRVASGALSAELPFVRVLMTLDTLAPHPEECPVLILHPDLLGFHLHFSCSVAAIALKSRVLSDQFEPRVFRMIEVISIELRELELFAIVLRVAPRAIELICGRFVRAGVEPSPRVDPPRDLRVTVEALQRPLTESKGVAAIALSRAF